MNNHNKLHSARSSSGKTWPSYEVPDDYDRTNPNNMLPLDHRLIDYDVAHVMNAVYDPHPGPDFAQCVSRDEASWYFSAPFCDIAKGFGYGSVEQVFDFGEE